MRPFVAAAIVLAGLAAGPAGADDPPSRREGSAAVEAVRQAVRSDKRALVEKNMQLTEAEAKRFWPVYETYQRDLQKIVQRQNRAVLDYVNSESSMTDANAKRIARELLKADADELQLRERQFRRVLAVLPPRKAVRYLQIENKISTLYRFDVSERVALVH
jgi:hypothetical protein